MTAKTPIKATFSGSDVNGLAEFTSADFVDVADGGTGVVTLTSGGVLVGAGTSAVTTNKAAPSGDFVGTSDTQTLTNKTITSATINTPTITGNTIFSDGAYDFDIASHDTVNGLKLGGILVTATAAEINALDGITSTVTELNIVDGDTSVGTTAIVGTDGLVTNDAGTMRQTSVDTLDTYLAATTKTLTNKTLTSPTITEPEVSTTLDMNAQASTRYYDSDSSNFVAFRAPATITSNFTLTWPDADGASGHVMTTDGAGNLSFAAGGGGGSSSGYTNSTISTLPGKNGNFDLSFNVAQTVQETPFDSGATDPFGVNLGSVFTMMDPVGTIEDAAGEGLDLGVFT
jgi:hypothetical protein